MTDTNTKQDGNVWIKSFRPHGTLASSTLICVVCEDSERWEGRHPTLSEIERFKQQHEVCSTSNGISRIQETK